MVMKTVLTSLDEVDEVLREHYTEQQNPVTKKPEFVLAIEGSIDPLPPVKALKTENATFRTKAKEFEEKYGKLKLFEGMNHEEVTATLARVEELEKLAGGKLDEKKIEDIVNGRIQGKLVPVQRELDASKNENLTLKQQIEQFQKTERQRKIGDEIRAAATATKMEPTAVEDAILLAERVMDVSETGVVTVKDNVGYTPGLDVKSWILDMQSKRPHWWGPSGGAGSRGNGGGNGGEGGTNPWSAANWNMTEQGRILNSDPKKAERLATQAGTKIGGMRPKAK